MKHSGVICAIILGASCAAAQPVTAAPSAEPDRPIPLLLIDDDPEALELVAEAGEVLGVEFELVDYYAYGVPILDLLNLAEGEGVLGTTFTLDECTRFAWADRDPIVVAHELGHVLGLDHHLDRDHLMFWARAGGTKVDDTERLTMRVHAFILEGCRA